MWGPQLVDSVTILHNYRKFSEIWTTLGIWAIIIILQNDQWEIWATLDRSPVGIAQIMDLAVNLADTASRYFQKNMGHPEAIKIVII